MAEFSQPPYSNTGAQNTRNNRVLLDWCGFTLSVEKFEKLYVQNLLLIPFDYFSELPKGANGYKKQAIFHGITVQWDGNEGMGIHIEMSGTGCRTFEGLHGNPWGLLFLEILEKGGHFTRIDLALDDFEKKLFMKSIESKTRKAHVRSRWKDARILNKVNLQEGMYLGRTIYFGSPSSRIIARFYDKALEQKSKGNDDVPEHWVRCELQCRDDRAEMVAKYIVDMPFLPLGELVSQFIRNYLEFLTPVKFDSNKSRWPVCGWWNEFLLYTGKLKLTQDPRKRDLEDIKHWLENQVSASLAMLSYNSHGELRSLEEVIQLAIDGKHKLKDKHLKIIHEYEIRLEADKKEPQIEGS